MKIFLLMMQLGTAIAQDSPLAAEQERLRREIRQYQKKNDWKQINRTYEKLSKIASKRFPLTFDDHVNGALASQELGQLYTCIQRLEKALVLKPDASERQWLSFLNSSTVLINIRVPSKDHYLAIQTTPFEPELQLAIEFAERELREKGRFQGHLPIGRYVFGEAFFDVEVGQKTKIYKQPPKESRVEKAEDEQEKQDQKAAQNRQKQEEKQRKEAQKAQREKEKAERKALEKAERERKKKEARAKREERAKQSSLTKGEGLSSPGFALKLGANVSGYLPREDNGPFRLLGPSFGLVGRYSVEKYINTPLSFEVAIDSHFAFSNSITSYGVLGRVFLKRPFGSWDFGIGYTADLSFLAYACEKPGEPGGINCEAPEYADNPRTSVGGQLSPLLFFASSGIGTSALWNVTPVLGREITTVANWDAEYSLFYWVFASAHLSFGEIAF
ncbi:MAG: cell envelope integrity protein TolA [Myxococcota bacterium]|nr:cell envelope integrity protein TolA [Myxococcota bacterium]